MWREVREILVGGGWEINVACGGAGGGGPESPGEAETHEKRAVRKAEEGAEGRGRGTETAPEKGTAMLPERRSSIQRNRGAVGEEEAASTGAAAAGRRASEPLGLRQGPRRGRGTYPDVRSGGRQSPQRLLSG